MSVILTKYLNIRGNYLTFGTERKSNFEFIPPENNRQHFRNTALEHSTKVMKIQLLIKK